MFSLLRRYVSALVAVVVIGGLAACATTDTGSEAVIEESSIESPAPVDEGTEQEAVEVGVEPEQPQELAPAVSGVPTQPEPAVTEEEFEPAEEAVTTAPAEQAEAVEPVAEFPIQRYEIEEPREIAGQTDSEADIERLRQELAAAESELERIRAEEEQRDYTASEAMTSAQSPGDDGFDESLAEPPQQTIAARAPQQPAPRGAASELEGAPEENSIYFGYDEASLDAQYESVLVAHAEFLKANSGLRVEIQGNCDERGSREYNIALGQRRALAVKRALELLGVAGYRIDTVSFGSEKPVAFGHDEQSWRLNRRADIVY